MVDAADAEAERYKTSGLLGLAPNDYGQNGIPSFWKQLKDSGSDLKPVCSFYLNHRGYRQAAFTLGGYDVE